MNICFFCGNPRNKMAVEDNENAENITLSYLPCKECRITMVKGITMIEAGLYPQHEDQPPIITKPMPLYPTGKWVVIKEESFKKLADGKMYEAVKDAKMGLVDMATFEELFGPMWDEIIQKTKDKTKDTND